ARRTKIVRRALVVGFVASLGAVYGGVRLKAYLDKENAVDAQVRMARVALDAATAAEHDVQAARAKAFALFDAKKRAAAEEAWRAAMAAKARRDEAFSAAAGEFEKASALGPGEPRVRAALADFLYARALVIEDPSRRAELRQRLQLYDD